MRKKHPIDSPPPPFSFPSASSHDNVVSQPTVCPTLPTDLIITILLKLPVKSLGKFKSVSKQWLHLIAGPYFSMHRELCLQTPNILLLKRIPLPQKPHLKKRTRIDICSFNLDGSRKNMGFSLYLNEDELNIQMLPSKWDLICFVSENRFYGCNPSKQEMFKLPEATRCTLGEVNTGMGYVKERDEYVLVHLFNRGMNRDIGCEVLRLSDGKDCEWKVINADFPFGLRGWGWGVLLENVFYLMTIDEYYEPGDVAIVSFDLAKEEFGLVSPPPISSDVPFGSWSLVELGGSLCLVDKRSCQKTIDIWVMKDYVNHRWILEYSIDMNGYRSGFSSFIFPLDYRKGEIWMDAIQQTLDYYDVEKKCIRRMDNLVAGRCTWLRLYTESFFSIGSR